MRIISGTLSGATLHALKGHKTRPTATRTREAIFSILQSAPWCTLAQARVLDICAGTGALGLEALSRGAGFCLFVEQGQAACDVIATNITALGQEPNTRIMRRNAKNMARRGSVMEDPFQLVFIDPPYDKGFGTPIIKGLVDGDWLGAKAVIVLEEDRRAPLPDISLALMDSRIYGDTQLLFYTTA